jgi:Tol biopolymer transport system component
VIYTVMTEPVKVFRLPLDGHQTATALDTQGVEESEIEAVSPDGKWVAVSRQRPRTFQIDLIPLDGSSHIQDLIAPKADAFDLTFSQNGKWIAYVSNETGRYEIYAGLFADTAARWQISKEGAAAGGWMKQPGKLLVVHPSLTVALADVRETGQALEVTKIEPVFGGKVIPGFFARDEGFIASLSRNITSDGKQILLAPSVEVGTPDTLNVVTDWHTLAGKS